MKLDPPVEIVELLGDRIYVRYRGKKIPLDPDALTMMRLEKLISMVNEELGPVEKNGPSSVLRVKLDKNEPVR